MKKRVGYFDIAKGIGIILVVIAHIEYMPLALREYIVTFHMPAFFVISGMLMNLTNERERPIKSLLIRKLKTIMLPYMVFSIVFPIIDIIRYAIAGKDMMFTFRQDIIAGITMTGSSVLWFLPALFFSELIVLAIIKNLKKPVLFILSVLIPVAIWFLALVIRPLALPMWRTVFCSVMVLFGYILFPLIKKLSAYPLFLLPAALILFVILYFTGKANDIVDLHFILLGRKPLYYLNAMMGSVALIMLSVFMEKYVLSGINGMLEFFGRHSLFIMVTHINFLILYFAEKLAFAISGAVPRGKELIFNITATVFTMLIETICILIWERIKKYAIISLSGHTAAGNDNSR